LPAGTRFGHRIAAGGTFEQRVEGGAEIGPEHQGKGRVRRHHALGRQRHREEHRRNARMRRPSHRRGDDHIDDRLRRDCTHQQTQARHVLKGGQHRKKQLQGKEHQPEAYRHTAEIARPACEAAAKQNDADQHKQRGDACDVERQQLHDQRGADIGSEHDRERRHQIDQPAGSKARRHEPGRGAALQYRGDAEAGQESGKPTAKRASEKPAQMRAEAALDAALHHMHAPQQQGDRAGKINQRKGGIHSAPPAAACEHRAQRINSPMQAQTQGKSRSSCPAGAE